MKLRRTRLSIDSLEDRVTPATAADLNAFAVQTQRTAFMMQELSKHPGMIGSPAFRPMVQSYFKGVFVEAQTTLSLLKQFPNTFSAGISDAIGQWATVNSNIAQSIGNMLGFSVVPPTPPPPPSVVGIPNVTKSTVGVSPASVATGGTTTVTLTAKDANGTTVPTGGATVVFSLGTGTGQGTFGTVTDHANGTYTAIFTGTTVGTNTIKATLNGKAVTTTAPTVTIVGAADATKSTVAASPATILNNGTSTITLTAKDANGNQLPAGGATVLFALGTGTGQGTFGTVTDKGNGTYTATFTGTTVGTNTITATLNGTAVTTTAPTITINAQTADATKSTVAIAPASVAVGSTSTITFTAKDANGNPMPTGGATVLFSLGTGTGQGTFGPVTDQGNGTYTATFTGTTAGTNTIKATLNGTAVTTTAPTVNVVGPADPTKSTVAASPTSILVNGTSNVTLTAKDANGSQLTSGGGTVVFSLGTGTAQGTFGTVTDNGNGTYSATFTGTTSGTNTIKATFNGTPVTTTAPTINVTTAIADATKSTVAIAPASIATNGTSTVTLTAKDANGNAITSGGATVVFSTGIGTGQGTFGTVTDNANGTYTATFTGTTAGTNTIRATLNGTTVSTVAPTITIVGPASAAQSLVALAPTSIANGSTTTVTLTAKDANGNQEPAGGSTVVFALGAGTADGTFGTVTDNGNGTYTSIFTATTAGTNTVTATIGGTALTSTAPTLTVT
jgi:adhesin/invasin